MRNRKFLCCGLSYTLGLIYVFLLRIAEKNESRLSNNYLGGANSFFRP